MGVDRGKVYYEATVTDEGLCRVGWSTQSATHELGEPHLLLCTCLLCSCGHDLLLSPAQGKIGSDSGLEGQGRNPSPASLMNMGR